MKMISSFILLTSLSASAFAAVPARLLDSIAFVESRMNPENIMGLSDDKASPHSFERAALLTGVDEQTLKNDPAKTERQPKRFSMHFKKK